MASAPAPAKGGGGPVAAITRKVGPLPVWAYAAILVAGYFLYRRLHPSTTSTAPGSSTGSTTADQAYVPGFDASGGGGSFGSGGLGNTSLPSTVNNYYYGTEAGAQAGGGGTATMGPNPPSNQLPGPSGGGGPYGTQPGGGQLTGQPITFPSGVGPKPPSDLGLIAQGLTPIARGQALPY